MAEERLKEETLNSERAFDGKLIKVRVDQVRLPNGFTARREVVEHPGAVAIVPLLEGDRVVLVRQYRHPANKILLEIPAGTLGPGEDPEACAVRELAEEIGYRPGKLVPLFEMFLAPGYSSELIRVFLASELEYAPGKSDEDEILEIETLPLEQVVAMIDRGEIQDAKTICGVLAVSRKRG